MNIDEDTSAWLGCPTPLEMYRHQCALLEDELIQTHAMLRKARRKPVKQKMVPEAGIEFTVSTPAFAGQKHQPTQPLY
ncbi:hypothetical protein [Pseudomonas lactucae]|uniref:Transposase n=1 Tax=Pseudomonas lactucae TaxID=2813360 RepID=A0A9X1C6K9_9PSED|nr:hypothetical protein [Pseudomonas lactucae]MBN2976927.1 hypothetical protein [Pseudomonas lactucae]MBN2988456.1 hypothetical protein [Pseudomonas lactucae]